MYGLLLVCIVLLLFVLQRREHFDLFGYPIFSMGSCAQMDERDAGLCYDKCTHGYGGVGPVCWKETSPSALSTLMVFEWENWPFASR